LRGFDWGRRGDRWNTRLLYVLAALTTISQGSMELTFPLNLHRLGFPLPLVGTTVAAMGLGQILSRLPGGHWYQPRRAPGLNSAFLVLHGLTTIGLSATPLLALQAGLGGLHGAAFGLVTTFQFAMLIDSRQREGSMAGTIAWYTAAISLGYAVGAPLGAAAIQRLGYAGAFWTSGGVAVLAAALSLLVVRPPARSESAGTAAIPGLRALLPALGGLPTAIWLAALLAFYINFMTDAIGSFFPIYAVAIGVPLGIVGLLRSTNSLVATGIRFGAAAIFRFVRPDRVNHVCVVAMAAATLGLSLVTGRLPLLAIFIALGACRGLIRVTSATFVADERAHLGMRVGLASAVYNAGLDAGTMLAPPITGLLAGTAGIPGAFRAVGLGLPLLYYGAWLLARVRRRPEPLATETVSAPP